MKKTITLNPVTRIEGHLAVKVEVDANQVSVAYVSGEMFRGFEAILRGRDPLDAQHEVEEGCTHALAARPVRGRERYRDRMGRLQERAQDRHHEVLPDQTELRTVSAAAPHGERRR